MHPNHPICWLCIAVGVGAGMIVTFGLSALVTFVFGLKEIWSATSESEITFDLGRLD
jgi:ABC-type transport system involved in cytochrome c biogenesis permease subunit